MGWIHDDDSGWHEAFLAPDFGGGVRGVGIYAGRDHEVIVGADYSVGAEPRYERRPAATAIGWRVVCSCSSEEGRRETEWVSGLLVRVPSKALEDLPAGRFYCADEDVDFLDDVEPYEEAARAIWRREHLAPGDSLTAIARAKAAAVKADEDLRIAVARARAVGQSWDAIGRAAGMTRQSAHARWS